MASIRNVILSFLPVIVWSAEIPCKHQFVDGPKATFDLSNLYLEDKATPYMANDTYRFAQDLKRPFTYFFNVCGDVAEPDEVELCHTNFGGKTAAAYQHIPGNDQNKGEHECYSLGRAEAPEWKYIDGDNAAVGVQLKYTQGSACRDAAEEEKERSFIIELACVHEATALPFISTVYENDLCEYKVTMESIYGCPMECHTPSHDKVCAGHGICAMDTGTHQARCFCNAGFDGETCEGLTTAVPKPQSSTHILSVLTGFVVVLLIGLLALAAVLYIKIKALNSGDYAYGQMNSGPMEE